MTGRGRWRRGSRRWPCRTASARCSSVHPRGWQPIEGSRAMNGSGTERVVAGHQPHYCPWLGYVDKISKVDVFCQIDVIPFDEQLFQHRNRIRAWTPSGEEWLTGARVVEGVV